QSAKVECFKNPKLTSLYIMKTGPGLTVKPVGFGKSKFKAEHSVRGYNDKREKNEKFFASVF
ncbi:hypothetical protein, partial [Heyndrickxia faecalis]|uniref:hypothetical protein n=1 Tax=Heyndrickxia faecalis TaxID=2824910 RepID=UPI003D198089